MAVSSGLYFLTWEKFAIDTAGESLEAEDHTGHLVTDTHTPAFDTDDFHADLDNEITGGNYAAETLTTTAITTSGSVLFVYDHDDVVYDNGGSEDVTISAAEALIMATNVGSSATNQLVYCLDFGEAVSCTNSLLTVAINASGVFSIDLVP